MSCFKKFLKKKLKDIPFWSTFYKVHSILYTSNLQDRNQLAKELPHYLLLILKYSLLYAPEEDSNKDQTFKEELLNLIRGRLGTFEDFYDNNLGLKKNSSDSTFKAILKNRQIILNQSLLQRDKQELISEYLDFADIFLKHWKEEGRERASKILDDKFGFTLKEIVYLFYALIAVEANKYNEDNLLKHLQPGLIREEARKKIFALISKSPTEAKEIIKSDQGKHIPDEESFYDLSIFEKMIPLIKRSDGTHFPIARNILFKASFFFIYFFLDKNVPGFNDKSEGKNSEKPFSKGVENFLNITATKLLEDKGFTIYTEKNLIENLGLKSKKCPDLMIESEESIFVFECKSITFGTEFNYTLRPSKFLNQLAKRGLLNGLTQLLSAYNKLRDDKKRRDKKIFLFIVTIDELNMPNWKNCKKHMFNEEQLRIFDNAQTNEYKTYPKEISEFPEELNLFFISIHKYHKLIQCLGDKERINKLCNELEEISKEEEPHLCWFNLQKTRSHNKHFGSIQFKKRPKCFEGLPNSSIHTETLNGITNEYKSSLSN